VSVTTRRTRNPFEPTKRTSRGPFDPTRPPAWRRRTAVVSLACLVVAAAGYGALVVTGSCGSPRSGVKHRQHECVGVSDGSYLFEPAYASVEKAILAENNDIGSHPAVTLAVLDPLTPRTTSANDSTKLGHQLQGEYLAQHRVNSQAGENGVRIRLVLANEGGLQDQWQFPVKRLIAMRADKAPLVAAVGMGVSVQETSDAAAELWRAGIPSIGAITTADQLNQQAVGGFFRVSPANSDYVSALLQHLKGEHFRRTAMVFDSSSEDTEKPDLFTASLKEDFERLLGRRLNQSALPYQGSLTDKGGPDLRPRHRPGGFRGSAERLGGIPARPAESVLRQDSPSHRDHRRHGPGRTRRQGAGAGCGADPAGLRGRDGSEGVAEQERLVCP
jgi:hypothetical protein